MTSVLLVIVMSGVGLALLILRQLKRTRGILDNTARPRPPSMEQYAPLFWLLSDHRLLYLRSHGGLVREFRIRHRRSRLFQRHLTNLICEFRSTSTALKTVVVQSPCDRPDLASRLVRTQISLFRGVMKIRLRLWRYYFGFR